jgi:hypothetical protein
MRLKISFFFEILFKKILFIVAIIFIFAIFENEIFFSYSMLKMSSSRVVTNKEKKNSTNV